MKNMPARFWKKQVIISILNDLEPEDTAEEVESAPEKETETQEATSQSLEDLGLKVEPSYDIEQVATEVATTSNHCR